MSTKKLTTIDHFLLGSLHLKYCFLILLTLLLTRNGQNPEVDLLVAIEI